MQTSKGESDSANSLHLQKLQEKADLKSSKKPKPAPVGAKAPMKVQMKVIAMPPQVNNLDLVDVVAPGRAGAAAANGNNRKRPAKVITAARAGYYSHVGKQPGAADDGLAPASILQNQAVV